MESPTSGQSSKSGVLGVAIVTVVHFVLNFVEVGFEDFEVAGLGVAGVRAVFYKIHAGTRVQGAGKDNDDQVVDGVLLKPIQEFGGAIAVHDGVVQEEVGERMAVAVGILAFAAEVVTNQMVVLQFSN
ncbi:MAG: hypothetical protein JWQ71_4482 [Pedosphaera sp.]|nr:hypothetical protein [Pedosphaera sp.]